MTTPDAPILISVVVPVYAGERYLRRLVEEISVVRAQWEAQHAPMQLSEVVLVDDGAIDGSPDIIDDIAADTPWIIPLHLMRNFGQHAATIASILHTSGDWVVTMDEDLQHPPGQIETLLRKAMELKADIVYANAADNVHEARSRDWASRGFKRLMVRLSGNPNVSRFSSFRLIRGSLARAASSVCGPDTYFDVALSWFTTRVGFVVMELKDERFITSGKSGYRFSSLLSHARRMFMSSQIKIMRLCGLFGILVVAASFLAGIALLVQHFAFPGSITQPGWTSLALIGLFFGGFISFLLGIALEYLSALLLVAHGKPIFYAVNRAQDRLLVEYFATRSP